MNIYVNRTLNFRKIKAIGLDMDYTLVRYQTELFESFTYEAVKQKLVQDRGYPHQILALRFDYQRFIHGIVIDKIRGNLLKLNRYAKVRIAYHGLNRIEFSRQQRTYANKTIDLNDSNILCLDTSFSVSHGILFAQLVDLKDQGLDLPDYEQMAVDIKEQLDIAHQDGTLKNEVKSQMDKYVVTDPGIPRALERLKKYGKKLFIVTNSDYDYTNYMLTKTLNPYLRDHQNWQELFCYTITSAQKPRFFQDILRFLRVDPISGLMTNAEGKIPPGIYQGGSASILEREMGIAGDRILYLGDHIYGDVVSIKKTMNWRTALVIEDLGKELAAMKSTRSLQQELEDLTAQKEVLEQQMHQCYERHIEGHEPFDQATKDIINEKIEKIDAILGEKIDQYQSHFNPYWGEITRAGIEESRFAGQVEKYACIYMEKISDLCNYSPRNYFRPKKRLLAHEFALYQ